MHEDDELLREFLVESYENLDRLDAEFVALEEDPGSTGTLSSIFRTIHTIKGTCGFLELSRLEALTHAGESLLSALREGRLSLTEEMTTALLRLVDRVRQRLDWIERHGSESEEEDADLIQTLQRLFSGSDGAAASEATAVSEESPEAAEGAVETEGPAEVEVVEAPNPAPADEGPTEPAAVREAASSQSGLASSNIRVQVEQLDHLMNLAGELVLARNQILQNAARSADPQTLATAQRLNLITTELQERIMKVRMQPVGTLWSKLPRLLRDLSRQLGKSIDLEMRGKETELDKTLIEAINDPLTHILRNAVDHGIEDPEARRAAGKDPRGKLVLNAYHESGQVFIEVVDDGRGIDADRVRAKAVAQGLISSEEAALTSEAQALGLIFAPGLSTAAAVTNVSGRGVGMDVVKTNIERLGGSVEVDSRPDRGTTVRIKIPLTLAIIPALIVTTAGDRYAIPQVSLVELVRLDGESARTGIEDLHGCPVYRLRGELLPLLFLDRELDVTSRPEALVDEEGGCRNIVVVRAGNRLFGLVVDEINDTEEIVVKPLDTQTQSVSVYAGSTILGDGRVSLILDVLGMARRAGVLGEGGPGALEADTATVAAGADRQTFLLVQAAAGRHVAIRLADVDRLEEFPREAVEPSGERQVVQYRGGIMPLVTLSEALGFEPSPGESVRVVVHSRGEVTVGLVVDAIADIVETVDPVTRPARKRGVRNAVVINGSVVDELDLEVLLEDCAPEVLATAEEDTGTAGEPAPRARQFCTFYLDDLFFGVDVMNVQEVLRHQAMTRVPLSRRVVRGLINLRGQTVTALDMRERLGLEERTPLDAEPMNLVLRTEGGIVSIQVDRIGDVLTVDDELHSTVPSNVRPEIHELLTGVYKLPEALLLPLDIERLTSVHGREAVS